MKEDGEMFLASHSAALAAVTASCLGTRFGGDAKFGVARPRQARNLSPCPGGCSVSIRFGIGASESTFALFGVRRRRQLI